MQASSSKTANDVAHELELGWYMSSNSTRPQVPVQDNVNASRSILQSSKISGSLQYTADYRTITGLQTTERIQELATK